MATAATDGRLVGEYVSIVTDEATLGANTFWGDLFSGLGGHNGRPLRRLREALEGSTRDGYRGDGLGGRFDPSLTLTRAQYRATVGNTEQRKPASYAGFANAGNTQQLPTAHS